MRIEFVGTYEECRKEALELFGLIRVPRKEECACKAAEPAAEEPVHKEPPKEAVEAPSEPAEAPVEEVPAEEPEAPQNEPESKSEAPVITMIDARARMNDLRANHGAAAVRAVLDEIGAKKFTDVPEDKYPELMVLVDAAEAGYAAQ